MNPTHCSSPALRWLAAGAGLATALYATRAGLTWLQYGHPPSPDMDETDRLLDEFIPAYEVVERHHVRVAAPAAIALAAACDMDLAQSAIIRGIFKSRELILCAHPDKVRSPRTLLAWAKELGWAVLAEIPDREVVLGAVTRPWDANPVFRPLPPQEFAGFHEPGYAKIVWTLRADPINATDVCRPHRNPCRDDRPGRPQSLPAVLVVGFARGRSDSMGIPSTRKKGSRRPDTASSGDRAQGCLERRTDTSSQPPMSERQPDERDPIQKILKAGALYFALVFGAWLRAWDRPHPLDTPEFRHKKGRTDGGAHHVRGNRSFRALGGSPSRRITFVRPAASLRPGRAWPLASCRIRRCTLPPRVNDCRVFCKPGSCCGNRVHCDAYSLCPHAIPRDWKIRFVIHNCEGS